MEGMFERSKVRARSLLQAQVDTATTYTSVGPWGLKLCKACPTAHSKQVPQVTLTASISVFLCRPCASLSSEVAAVDWTPAQTTSCHHTAAGLRTNYLTKIEHKA